MDCTYHKVYYSLLVFIILIGCNADKELYIHSTYQDGLLEGRRQHKPIFIHFTGYGCHSTDEFWKDFLHNPTIKNMLLEDFICVELFVDERAKMSMEDIRWVMKYPFSDSIKHRILKFSKIGPLNSELEQHLYQKASQPLYTFINSEEILLVPILGYTARDSIRFLENIIEAKKAFESIEVKE